MKDSLFEMLLNLFEKTLSQLKEKQQVVDASLKNQNKKNMVLLDKDEKTSAQLEYVKHPSEHAMRVFTLEEQIRLTKASYQFLMRMINWGVISADTLELVINRLIFSDSRFISLQETKWTIRSTLAESLDAEQLAFLDLVLYQKEDGLALH